MLIYPGRNSVANLSQIPEPIVLVAPDIEPVSLAEMKRHMRIDEDQTETDEDIDNLITAGRQFVEAETGLTLIDTTLEMRLDSYPSTHIITLRSPVIEVVSFEYTDDAGDLVVLATTEYSIETTQKAARILPAYGVTWPTSLWQSNSLRIVWRAGFVDRTESPAYGPELVPMNLRQAIKLHAEAHYFRDERMMQPLIEAAENLCKPYRVNFGLA